MDEGLTSCMDFVKSLTNSHEMPMPGGASSFVTKCNSIPFHLIAKCLSGLGRTCIHSVPALCDVAA